MQEQEGNMNFLKHRSPKGPYLLSRLSLRLLYCQEFTEDRSDLDSNPETVDSVTRS